MLLGKMLANFAKRSLLPGLKVYHPNFYGRQLGFRQAIPVPFFDSAHCGTSFHLHSPQEFTFLAARRSLEVMSKIARKLVALNFECTPSFATWWEAKWSKKYGGDLREVYDSVDVGLDEEAVDAAMQGVGSSHATGDIEEIFELFGHYEGDAEPVVETQAPRTLGKKESLSPKLLLLRPKWHMLPLLGLSLQRPRLENLHLHLLQHLTFREPIIPKILVVTEVFGAGSSSSPPLSVCEANSSPTIKGNNNSSFFPPGPRAQPNYTIFRFVALFQL
ncbi:hypothetical protein D8674_010690 [Pyrus ussuriensis x Pyrus communis]|uniref:Uncharacterized protein n=1 Tax=Pyrus ussuriensis x Pyrus communis TaxID=2448454 RepID=A0A5N5FBE8_9ROSA|nr:hypothetical protein D8674_010690 [Pyrus ussuriensis x Pyrus communis]